MSEYYEETKLMFNKKMNEKQNKTNAWTENLRSGNYL